MAGSLPYTSSRVCEVASRSPQNGTAGGGADDDDEDDDACSKAVRDMA